MTDAERTPADKTPCVWDVVTRDPESPGVHYVLRVNGGALRPISPFNLRRLISIRLRVTVAPGLVEAIPAETDSRDAKTPRELTLPWGWAKRLLNPPDRPQWTWEKRHDRRK